MLREVTGTEIIEERQWLILQVGGPLTLKFYSAMLSFLRIDGRHEAYQYEKNYYQHDKGYFFSLFSTATQNHTHWSSSWLIPPMPQFRVGDTNM